MGSKSTLSESKREKIWKLHTVERWGYDRIAARLNVPRGQVERYVKSRARTEAKAPHLAAGEVPELPADATSVDRARAQVRRLEIMIKTGAADPAKTSKDVSMLENALGAASTRLSRLLGEFEVTSSQIVRSTHFQSLLGAFQRAIGDDHGVWQRFEAECARLMGERK